MKREKKEMRPSTPLFSKESNSTAFLTSGSQMNEILFYKGY